MKRVEEHRVEICILEEKVQGMIKGIKMMNSSTIILDEILLIGRRSRDNTGLIRTPKGSSAGSAPTVGKRDIYHHIVTKYMVKGEANTLNLNYNGGCSRHMTKNKSYLSKIEKVRSDYVTFGRGEKDRIVGKGLLSVDGLPKLKDVLLVEGLTTNLISISQLYNNGMKVAFNKDE
ncbi:hypothetical protein LIER_41752 [Lithospermum erythrorhizon]|uniref:Retrovirus-related Pol polyprotein from transposon TNT 1-94-like beta-barrel domain-containing protein n=1 Tax=Lithospermum erythrorhizon TaxID=34254 RepID=A0AAV3RHJ5_LITER